MSILSNKQGRRRDKCTASVSEKRRCRDYGKLCWYRLLPGDLTGIYRKLSRYHLETNEASVVYLNDFLHAENERVAV